MLTKSSGSRMYSPLDGEYALRFLKLAPGDSSDQLSLELVHDSIAQGPVVRYEALSYTWGDPLPTKTVLCNGLQFELRINAFEFLQQLRQRTATRLLWMDCICINQEDLSERAQQVSIMSNIYRLASTVIVWLGPGDQLSNIAMNFISQQDPQPMLKEMSDINFSLDDRTKTHIFRDRLQDDKDRRLVQTFISLFSRKWFRRVWIQQEASANKNMTVLHGADQVTWEQLISVFWTLVPNTGDIWPDWTESVFTPLTATWDAVQTIQESRFHRLGTPRNKYLITGWDEATCYAYDGEIRHTGDLAQRVLEEVDVKEPVMGPVSSFGHMMLKCSACEATDPRDKVYALYSLYDRAYVQHRPKLDYSVPWQIVYTRAFKWIHSTDFRSHNVRSLSTALFHAGRIHQSSSDLPSWVIDLRYQVPFVFREANLWKAGGPCSQPNTRFVVLSQSLSRSLSLPKYTHVDGQGKKRRIPNEGLEVTALLQDKIAFLSSPNPPDLQHLRRDASRILEKVAADLQHVEEKMPIYFTGEEAIQAYAATLIANTDHHGRLASLEYEKNGFNELRTWFHDGLPDPDPVFLSAVYESGAFTRNRFCTTVHGLMCLAPATVTTSDYVAILERYNIPVLLRKVDPAQQYYELLGPCYVHRMMKGRTYTLMHEFRCKHQPGSEDEAIDLASNSEVLEGLCSDFPFNAKNDYKNVIRVIGKRRITLV